MSCYGVVRYLLNLLEYYGKIYANIKGEQYECSKRKELLLYRRVKYLRIIKNCVLFC